MRHITHVFLIIALFCIGQAYAADPVRIPIECEDMQGVQVGPRGFTPEWTFGKWGRDLHQNMIFGGVWASRLAAAVTDAGNNPAAAILLPVRQAGLQPEVSANRRGVVCSILDGPNATVVTVLKLGEDTVMDEVQQSEPMLIVHDVRPAKRVHTAMNAPGLAYQNTRDGIAITLPALNDADVIVIEH